MIIVLLMTVFVDLLQAVAVGMILASLLFIKQMSNLSESKSFSTFLKELYETTLPDEAVLKKYGNRIYV